MEMDSDNSVNESSCDEDDTEIETVKVSSSFKQKKDRGNILSFFPGSPTKNIPRPVSVENSRAEKSKERKKQVHEHVCIYKNCFKSICRGDPTSKKRHADTHHKNNSTCSVVKHIA